jgi:Copper transport outer membrane protein, MctB
MFTFRYHLVSLAAVFVALAVGILIGAAISGKLSEAEDRLTQDRIQSLNDQLQAERGRSDIIERRSEAADELVSAAYPTLMQDRLEGRGFAILFVGPVDSGVRSAVERTLADAGAGGPVRLVALDTPVDPTELDAALEGDEQLVKYAESGDDFGDLGEALGRELVEGKGTPLWSALSSELIEERSGSTSVDVDGAVVIRSWAPSEDTDGDEDAKTQSTESLFAGLMSGLDGTGLPVVGVEATTATGADSALAEYRREGLSTVDDIDTVAGRLALALLLAGGQPGHYGVKDSAPDGVVPPIEPVTTTTGG